MKKNCVLLTMLLVVGVPCWAVITSIQTVQGNAYTATYNAATGQILWSGGASATLYDSVTGPVATTNFSITANFSGLTDSSSGGWAKGTFSLISWHVGLLSGPGGPEIGYIEGTQDAGELFTEIEGNVNPFYPYFGGPRINPNQLFGSGVVTVTDFDFGAWGATWGDPIGGAAKLKSQANLSSDFGSYLTDNYQTTETTMWLYADETVIPEPATMLLLGLGAVLLRKKK